MEKISISWKVVCLVMSKFLVQYPLMFFSLIGSLSLGLWLFNIIVFKMFFFLVTGISFIFFLKSLHLKPLPSWVSDVRFLPLLFWKDLSFSFPNITKAIKKGVLGGLASVLAMKHENSSSKHERMDINEDMSVLDLPDLALECVLEKLSPAGLCNMASVCSSLRERCTSDYFWERHMNQKWGKVLGPATYQEWQRFIFSQRDSIHSKTSKSQKIVSFIWNVCTLSKFMSKHDKDRKVTVSPRADSVMSWYLALENGKFWFPAQVYNRENGHVGFMLSCYDAELSYDSLTGTFQARYPPHGRRTIAMENGVEWERIRAAPVDTSPYDLHITDYLNNLHPGDDIEIQWRRNKEFPYGWWYGVVAHSESCDGNDKYCLCHSSDTVVLEFKQYAVGSRWRRTNISRKDHREEGNESDGFYGGIRKLHKNDEIGAWKKLWPREIVE